MHGLHSSSFWGLPYRILNIHQKRNYYGAYGLMGLLGPHLEVPNPVAQKPVHVTLTSPWALENQKELQSILRPVRGRAL